MQGTGERIVIISTGDEVVEGRTVDTNASFIADRLAGIGCDVVCKLTVGDYPDRLLWAWQQAIALGDVVISTGGLGPTADDRTTEAVAEVSGLGLVMNEAEAEKIRGFFKLMDRPMPENNLRQALLPEGAEVVENRLGTAPGYRVSVRHGNDAAVVIVLPGVPREMIAMVDNGVIPWFVGRRSEGDVVRSRTFQTFGMSESGLDEALCDLVPEEEGRVAFRASFPQIAVRLTVAGAPDDVDQRLLFYGDQIAERIGGALYAEGELSMEGEVGRLLAEHGKTLTTAESCTGGLIGSRITDVPGSSNYYRSGIVAYSNQGKKDFLGVSSTTLKMFGAVSEEVASEMAMGAREKTGADIAIATTGIAGPGGGTEEKPVGTVAVAIAADGIDEQGVKSQMYQLWGNRHWVKTLTSQVGLDWVRRFLLGLDPLESNFNRRRRAV